MSGNILLIYPKYTFPRKSPPLGLAYLAAYIRKEGYNPLIVDLNIDNYSDGDISELAKQKRPLLIGISFMTNQYGEALRLSNLLKNVLSTTHITVGGPHVSALPREILRECPAIDFSVVGEGEITFLELLKALDSGEKDLTVITEGKGLEDFVNFPL